MAMSRDRESKLSELPSWTLFEDPDWLEIVAPGEWAEAEVRNGGQLFGRLPYVFRQVGPYSRITVPPLTPWLGPWTRASEAKPGSDLGRQHDIVSKLLNQLPKADSVTVPCAPEFANLLPFYWAGFDLRLAYTYRLNLEVGENVLWAQLKDSMRREIRKASKEVVVESEVSAQTLFELVSLTFRRQGLMVPRWLPTLEAILSRYTADRYTALVARDKEGRPHGAILFLHDARHTFYLTGGGDPDLRNSGAQSLLMWEGIRRSVGRSRVFDFEGSMVQGVERFVRGFGATQVPRYYATQTSPQGRIIQVLRNASSFAVNGIRVMKEKVS